MNSGRTIFSQTMDYLPMYEFRQCVEQTEQSLYTILQITSVTLFEKIPLLQALMDINVQEESIEINNQLNLFN